MASPIYHFDTCARDWRYPSDTSITTEKAAYALRAYRFIEQERWHIEYEHGIIRYAVTKGLPALLPLPLAETGETIFFHQNHFYALFPFAAGYQVKRGRLTGAELTELGTFLGRLHDGLYDYPQARVQQRIFSVDSEKTLTKIKDFVPFTTKWERLQRK